MLRKLFARNEMTISIRVQDLHYLPSLYNVIVDIKPTTWDSIPFADANVTVIIMSEDKCEKFVNELNKIGLKLVAFGFANTMSYDLVKTEAA